MRPKHSCTVAMSAIATLPPMACWSPSPVSTATMSSRTGEPEASAVSVSPGARPRRSANVRVIAIALRRDNNASPARTSRPAFVSDPTTSVNRPNGASENGSSPSTSSVSSKPRCVPSSTPASPFPGVSVPTSVFTSTTGAAASTPGVRRMRENHRSSKPSATALTHRFERPATASTVSPNDASAEVAREPDRHHHRHAERHAEHHEQRAAGLSREPAEQEPADQGRSRWSPKRLRRLGALAARGACRPRRARRKA
jgi:hypothetical protein